MRLRPRAGDWLAANLPKALRRQTVSLFGYGTVLALLILCSAETYRIQDSLSGRHTMVYQRYLVQDNAARALRRDVFLAGNHVRDFFLSTEKDRGKRLESELRKLREDCESALARLGASLDTAKGRTMRANLMQFFGTIEPVAHTMLQATDDEEYAFVQREVSPRRTQVYTELLEMTEGEQEGLRRAEAEFAGSRRAALWGVLQMLGLCVALGVLVAWFSLRHARRLEMKTEQQYDEVARAKGELERLSARLVETEEESRRVVSRELHDEIGQTLTALRIEVSRALKHAERAPVRESLGRARALAERSVETVRNICLLLRPALLDELGLVPAVQALVEDFSRRSGIDCRLTEPEGEENLPETVKICVYRIVQEALNNCEKHSAATRIEVSIEQRAGVLRIEVADNGRGFAQEGGCPPGERGGLGILGMRERALMVGGTLTIESAGGKGARVIASIPALLRAEHPETLLDGAST